MATKRLKFLKRTKIKQEDIRITLDVSGSVKRFTASLSLGAYDFPLDAIVVIEAKQLLETLRFDIGQIRGLGGPVTRDVSRLVEDRIAFNVLVLDPATARKLGTATTVRPNVGGKVPDHANSLLPVESRDLDPLVWEIEYSDQDEDGHTDAPVLIVDSRAAGESPAFFLHDPSVRALVLPAAMREVLIKILIIEETPFERESRSWKNSWIRLASRLAGEDPPDPDDANFKEEAGRWIDTATRELARRGDLMSAYLRERSNES